MYDRLQKKATKHEMESMNKQINDLAEKVKQKDEKILSFE